MKPVPPETSCLNGRWHTRWLSGFKKKKKVLCNLHQTFLLSEMPLGGPKTSSAAWQPELLRTIHLWYQVPWATCLFLTSFLCKETPIILWHNISIWILHHKEGNTLLTGQPLPSPWRHTTRRASGIPMPAFQKASLSSQAGVTAKVQILVTISNKRSTVSHLMAQSWDFA